MSDFKKPAGSVSKGTSFDPRKGGKPSAGITNESRGMQAAKGPGEGKPANPKRIR